MAMYFEFNDVPARFGTPEEIFDEYGVRITSDGQLASAAGVLAYIYILCRVLCFLCVKV